MDILFERDSPRLERRFKVSPVVIVARNENGKDLTFLRWGCTSFPTNFSSRNTSLSSSVSSLLPCIKSGEKKRKEKKIRNARGGLFDRSRINGGRINPWRSLLRINRVKMGIEFLDRILPLEALFFQHATDVKQIALAVFNGFLPGVVVISSPPYLCHELVHGPPPSRWTLINVN